MATATASTADVLASVVEDNSAVRRREATPSAGLNHPLGLIGLAPCRRSVPVSIPDFKLIFE
jgi:hypothetical protein